MALCAAETGQRPMDVLCVIGPRPLDQQIVARAGMPFERLQVGGVKGMAPWQVGLNLSRFALAVPRAAAILRRFKPHAVLLGGGYVCAPVAVAAWTLRIPMLTLCVDVVPGWSVRLAARLSTRVAIAFAEAAGRMPAGSVTGYPLRTEFRDPDRSAARRRFGIPDGDRLVLAFGGSLGARSINQAIGQGLASLLPHAHVVHVTGGNAESTVDVLPEVPAELTGRYHHYRYLDAGEMAAALAAADLAVCRAGASTMAELPAVGLPAVLIPGEFSAQEQNAQMMAQRGAALMIHDRDLTSAGLVEAVVPLLLDAARLERMAEASRALARPDAAERVAGMVREVAGCV
jgi:UDP-N-acetylglucosamine--N-acetylmuramyl-(pentapeptide) pyrophosphoryl-undecaprenol N-acetylglucosamine transferase